MSFKVWLNVVLPVAVSEFFHLGDREMAVAEYRCNRAFQENKGPYSHIVVICDYYTKWIEIFPSEKPNSDSIALLMCDAISRYGFPLGFLTPWGARGIQVRTVVLHYGSPDRVRAV